MKGTTASTLAVVSLAAIGIGAALWWRSAPEPRPRDGAPAAEPEVAPTVIAPPSASPAPPPGSPLPAASPGPPAAPADEASLMTRLRAIASSDPGAAAELAREGNSRFPDSADAPERTSILIHALAALDRPSEARGEAEEMVTHYPDSRWVQEVERFTGAHRHRNVILEPDGALRFE
jgi:hypothetical protein